MQIEEDLLSNKSTSRTSAEDLSVVNPQQHDSLTLSEDSDTTRVYDLNRRETSILRINLDKIPTTSITPPSTPVDAADQPNSKTLFLDEGVAFQQLSQLKRNSAESLRLLSPVDTKRSIVHATVPKVKIIHKFPYKKMEDEVDDTYGENGTEVPAGNAPPPPVRSRSTSPIPDYVSVFFVL